MNAVPGGHVNWCHNIYTTYPDQVSALVISNAENINNSAYETRGQDQRRYVYCFAVELVEESFIPRALPMQDTQRMVWVRRVAEGKHCRKFEKRPKLQVNLWSRWNLSLKGSHPSLLAHFSLPRTIRILLVRPLLG